MSTSPGTVGAAGELALLVPVTVLSTKREVSGTIPKRNSDQDRSIHRWVSLTLTRSRRSRPRSVALGRARSRSVALGRARSRSVAPIPRKCLVVFGQDEDSPLALALPALVPRRWP